MASRAENELDIVAREKVKRLPKFVVRRSPAENAEDSYVCVTLTYRADPEKDSIEWLMRQAARMPDHRAVRREFLLDWTSAEGDAFYPNFATAPERFVSSVATFNPKWPVFRGFDFGYRHPACVWLQKTDEGRIHVLHDLLPTDIDTHSLRDLVLFLSGQSLRPGTSYEVERELGYLAERPRAFEYAARYIKEGPWWTPAGARKDYPVPFFPPGTRFFNYSGPEAYKVAAQVESNKKERTDAEVFESGGIFLDCAWQSVEAGETLIRKTLLDRDGRPGLICAPSAVNTINALGGGIVYAKSTPAKPRPETAQKDGLFEHVHDALRYTITHVVDPDLDLPERVEPSQYRGQKEFEEALEGSSLSGWEETGGSYEEDMDWNDLDSFV
jgi:hypothetical protein